MGSSQSQHSVFFTVCGDRDDDGDNADEDEIDNEYNDDDS